MKSHWFIRGIGWIGVAIMMLAAPIVCTESYANRDTAPWKLGSVSAMAFGAGVCVAQHLVVLLMAVFALGKRRVDGWLKKEPGGTHEAVRVHYQFVRDRKRQAATVRTIMCVCAIAIVAQLISAWNTYGSDSYSAQYLWRCGGVPMIYITGVMSAALAFFYIAMPIVDWVNWLFIHPLEKKF